MRGGCARSLDVDAAGVAAPMADGAGGGRRRDAQRSAGIVRRRWMAERWCRLCEGRLGDGARTPGLHEAARWEMAVGGSWRRGGGAGCRQTADRGRGKGGWAGAHSHGLAQRLPAAGRREDGGASREEVRR